MKIAGIIGGIAPESTIEYYRSIVRLYRSLRPDGSYPRVLINSIDLTHMISFISAGDLEGVADYISSEISRLADAGADFALLASNTPHIVFAELQRRSPIPMVSIVEAACAEARRLGLRRLGFFGTRFTMQGNFYPDVFSREGIELVQPSPSELEYIHDKYMGELVNALFLSETRDRLLAIASRMRDHDRIDGLILAGTELPLLLRDVTLSGIPFLDTTQIHVEAVVRKLLD